MTKPRLFSDEVLTAYLDNEVDLSTKAAIEDALDADPGLSDRLEKLQVPGKVLVSALDSLLGAAPDMPVLPVADRPVARQKPYHFAVAASLVLGLALGAGLMSWRTRQPAGWMDYVAAYQALYVGATLTSVQTSPEKTAASLSTLGTAIGYKLGAADHDSVLEFKRGQILGYKGNALVQLAYLSPLGEPVALCIIRRDGAGDAGISVVTLEGMAAAHWQKDGFAFLLIGGTDPALIREAALRMAARI